MLKTLTYALFLFIFISCEDDYNSDGINLEAPPALQNGQIAEFGDDLEIDQYTEADLKEFTSEDVIVRSASTHEFTTLSANDIAANSSFAQANSNTSPLNLIADKRASLQSPPKPKAKTKIIWSAGLDFQVNNVDSATAVIGEIATLNDGFIAEMNKTQDSKRINNTITIKVNSENFQKTIKSLKSLAIHLTSERINSQDVSKEYIDAESRLKTKQEVLERYKDILRTRTGNIEEVLDAEEKIRRLTEEIEAKKGYLRYLSDRIKYSRINLSIYEKVEFIANEPARYEKTFGDKAIAGFGNGWAWIQNFVLVIITLWPLLLIAALVIFWKRKWVKKNILG